jgi:hypothetical protein
MKTERAALVTAALWVLAAAACATAPVAVPLGAPERQLLSEQQAVLAIQEALVKAGALAERGYQVTLDGHVFEADVHFAKPPFAIEWVSADDRRELGALLPTGTPTSPLQIVSGAGVDGVVQVLVLDPQAYTYEANPLRVQRGAGGIEDAERKLRSDVTEFLDYVRDQGGRV